MRWAHLLKLVLVIGITMALACSDKEIPPEEQGELFYKLTYMYAMYPSQGVVDAVSLTFNTRTGAIIDSTYSASFPYADFAYSADGTLMYCTTTGSTWIMNSATGDTLAINSNHGGSDLALAPNEQYLTTWNSSHFSVYELPSLTVVFEMDASYFWPAFHPTKDLLYYIRPTATSFDGDSLFWLDLDEEPAYEHNFAVTDTLGEFFPVGLPVLSADGKWLLGCFKLDLLLLDTDSLQTHKMFRSPDHWGQYWPAATNYAANKVYLGYVDSPLLYPEDGGVDVFDFNTLTLTSLVDKSMNPGLPGYPAAWLAALTPDGSKFYGGNITGLGGTKGLFETSTATRETTVFLPDRPGTPVLLKLNPKPFYD